MKRNARRLLCCLIAVLFVVTPLSSCAGDGPVTIAQNGSSAYLIVYENGNRDAANAAEYLAEELEYLTDAVLEVTDDRTEADPAVPEIRVGRTNRGRDYSLQRTVRVGSYVIAREGQNIYILGAGDGVLERACEDFCYEVMDDDCRVSGTGELLSTEPRYSVSAVTLNARPLTDYTVYLPERAATHLKEGVACLDEQLSAVSGFMLTTDTYTDASDVSGPALVLMDNDALGEGEYKIEDKGGDVYHLSAGSEEAAMAMMIALAGRLLNKNGESVTMDLSAGGGKTGESPLVPYGDADVRVMCFNVFGNNEHKSLMPYVTASAYAYAADFICMQEFYEVAYNTVGKDLEKAGYKAVGTTFTEVSPTALEHKDTDDKYQKFAYVGSICYTPIYYRADIWEPVESGAYLFYWMNRYHGSNTKSVAYGVFRNKTTGEEIAVFSTHYPLMAESYRSQNKDGRDYSACTDKVDGAAWRSGATQEILKQVELLRAAYPGIPVVGGGDLNATATEASVRTLENHVLLTNASVAAPEDMRNTGSSFHDYGKKPGTANNAIDHLFVSEDKISVLRHRIVSDNLTVKGTDHCPVVIDIKLK